MRHLSPLVALLIGVALLASSVGGAKADRRIALVIGNAAYDNHSLRLGNPENDAGDVAAALRSLGFEVIQTINANKRNMDLSMAKFARLAGDSDAALFYYAGHALQYQGRNYLMPTDAEVEDEISLRYQMVPIDDVRAALDRSGGVKVMVLDACRNNPVVESLRRRASGETRGLGGTRGLARIDKTQGTVIAYSTAADAVAADGSGRNSPFTTAFLRRLKEPGLEIEQMFRRIASDVNTATNGRQRPETYVSLLSDYYLNQTDRIAFDAIKNSTDPAALRDFIAKFPTSNYVSDARYRLQRQDFEAQEKQLQEVRQQEAMRLLQDQSKAKANQEAAARKQDEQRRQDEHAKAAENARIQAERKAAIKLQAERESARLQAEAVQRLQNGQKRIAAAKVDAPAVKPDSSDAPISGLGATTKVAGLERQDPGFPASAPMTLQNPGPKISVVPPRSPTAAIEPAPPPPAVSTDQTCDQDNARLAALRGDPSLDSVLRFERELRCDRLRPQVARLRESLSGMASAPAVTVAELTRPAAEKPSTAVPQPAIANVDKSGRPQDCKQDEERLSRLRASPSVEKVVAFERELGCEKLRPQLKRLRESLGPPSTSSEIVASRREDTVLNRQIELKPPATHVEAMSREKACEQDRATLIRLRASQSRDAVIRFERDLACKELRPQVLRLKESLGG